MSKLYPYPTVQYIPLILETHFQQETSPRGVFLLIEREISMRKEQIQEKLGIQLPTLPFNPHRLLLFSGGIEPQEVKYRGYYVTIKAVAKSVLSLVSIPKHYFYKDTLVFQAKNENGEILISKLYQLDYPPKAKAH